MKSGTRYASWNASLRSIVNSFSWSRRFRRNAMQVHLSIGENHRFELHEALLVYRDNQSSFITRHEVTARKDAPPTLGPAQPLTVAFIESLVRSLGGAVQAEVLPASVLAKIGRASCRERV